MGVASVRNNLLFDSKIERTAVSVRIREGRRDAACSERPKDAFDKGCDSASLFR